MDKHTKLLAQDYAQMLIMYSHKINMEACISTDPKHIKRFIDELASMSMKILNKLNTTEVKTNGE